MARVSWRDVGASLSNKVSIIGVFCMCNVLTDNVLNGVADYASAPTGTSLRSRLKEPFSEEVVTSLPRASNTDA